MLARCLRFECCRCKMKTLVTGATGLIGRSVCQSLTSQGHSVVGLSRSPRSPAGLAVAEIHQWDTQTGPPPEGALSGVDAVVNLAGEPIDARRRDDQHKRLIRDSRVLTTMYVVDGLRLMDHKP